MFVEVMNRLCKKVVTEDYRSVVQMGHYEVTHVTKNTDRYDGSVLMEATINNFFKSENFSVFHFPLHLHAYIP